MALMEIQLYCPKCKQSQQFYFDTTGKEGVIEVNTTADLDRLPPQFAIHIGKWAKHSKCKTKWQDILQL